MKTIFSYSKNFIFKSQIPFTCSCLSTKFSVFPIKFKGDIHNSFKHVLMLCYYAYLSV